MGRGKKLLMKIRRGDILYVDLGVQYQGSMQGGMRPVVVVSNNRANKHSTVITVVPLSTKIYKKRSLPTHVFISSYKTEELDQHSIVLCEQVTALNFDQSDTSKIRIDRDKTMEEKKAQYLRKVGNPYLVKVGNIMVKIRFANNGVSCLLYTSPSPRD